MIAISTLASFSLASDNVSLNTVLYDIVSVNVQHGFVICLASPIRWDKRNTEVHVSTSVSCLTCIIRLLVILTVLTCVQGDFVVSTKDLKVQLNQFQSFNLSLTWVACNDYYVALRISWSTNRFYWLLCDDNTGSCIAFRSISVFATLAHTSISILQNEWI